MISYAPGPGRYFSGLYCHRKTGRGDPGWMWLKGLPRVSSGPDASGGEERPRRCRGFIKEARYDLAVSAWGGGKTKAINGSKISPGCPVGHRFNGPAFLTVAFPGPQGL